MKGFNISEAATPISVEEEKGLLLTHISTLKELNHWEQINIVKAIETSQRKTKLLTEALQQSMSLAKERRAALIAAAVTGQIDVRGLVTEPEAA